MPRQKADMGQDGSNQMTETQEGSFIDHSKDPALKVRSNSSKNASVQSSQQMYDDSSLV